ncbi:MAG TPA: Rne/Rng family ribonuclease [Candidatus Borkfalkia excrementigallinarum]|uniref:Rne/Rng family ribonuclease n=1 Tax=Candidatus Borkfalkia excrementigallinarum TaxID=2838506 RepID=A0A9D2A0B3_9FIRM|nr:Rne/Rng family ribonuclease [Candidatus Borkfalkia excrementigallinarum]
MQKNMYFDYFGSDCFAAVAEDGRLVEFHLDSGSETEISGNIYKGRVMNVLEGMQAAFVAFGQEKNGYLYAGDIPSDADRGVVMPLCVKAGDEVMVQVSKSPMGKKGARLTMCLSYVGKHLIFMPTSNYCAVSRKITDESEREMLLAAAKKLSERGGGFVMRTSALTADPRELRAEANYLRALYDDTVEAYKTASVGDMVYRDADLHARLLRDFDLDGIDKIYIGDEQTFNRAERLFKRARRKNKLVLYNGEREMFEYFGLEKQVFELMSTRVELASGAYLIIDHTEALTAIDVNTGRFTGETDLEDTVFSTNLLAAREIARQVRLRNVGGIVVVDFIDMASEEHRAALVEELEKCLREDRAKCNVVPMTGLGLIQFSRKKFKSDNVSMLTKKCPYCRGAGYILSDAYIAFRIQIALKKCFADGYENAIVELNAGVFAEILAKRRFSALVKGEWRDKRVYMIPHRTYHEDQFTVRGDNSNVLTLPDTAKLLY